jgi:hypothetical protein
MRSAYLKAMLFALAVVAAPALSYAADSTPIRITRTPAPVVGVAGATDTIIIEQASPIMPAPIVRYGCSRVWRCDSVVCEWRRGCWGTYGYMEGPYYTLTLAKRQWERHGWPMPPEQRARYSLSK